MTILSCWHENILQVTNTIKVDVKALKIRNIHILLACFYNEFLLVKLNYLFDEKNPRAEWLGLCEKTKKEAAIKLIILRYQAH